MDEDAYAESLMGSLERAQANLRSKLLEQSRNHQELERQLADCRRRIDQLEGGLLLIQSLQSGEFSQKK